MVTHAQIRKLEEMLLKFLHAVDEVLNEEEPSKNGAACYEDRNADRLYQISGSVQDSWLHLGRLRNRMEP